MPNTTHQSSDKIIINQISVATLSQNTHQIFNWLINYSFLSFFNIVFHCLVSLFCFTSIASYLLPFGLCPCSFCVCCCWLCYSLCKRYQELAWAFFFVIGILIYLNLIFSTSLFSYLYCFFFLLLLFVSLRSIIFFFIIFFWFLLIFLIFFFNIYLVFFNLLFNFFFTSHR